MKSLFEEMGGTYTLGADGMYYPNLALPEEEPHYGKYGRMRLHYLKEHRKVLYNTLLLEGKKENFAGFSSPYWGSSAVKSTLRPSIRAGVPVFIRPASKPRLHKYSVSPYDTPSPALPPGALARPVCISPFRKVPLVRMTARALKRTPITVCTPVIMY